MTPHQALDNLLQARRVKLTDEYFKEIQEYWKDSEYQLKINEFVIHQIEEVCVNLYNVDLEEVIYDIPYSELLNID
mgnify:FL=1